MLGLKRGTVKLVKHNHRWAKLFNEEKRRLKKTLGKNMLAIEHIGSTSIPGLKAKPILDIAIIIPALNKKFIDRLAAKLAKLGYAYIPWSSFKNRRLFIKGPEAKRTHHLHIVKKSNKVEWNDALLFRDYLKSHLKVRADYEKLKVSLAKKYPADRKRYTTIKKRFIIKILKQAGNNKK